jgi:hypothetical protein
VWLDAVVSGEKWTNDERAAARAFLQRSEVRLGTIHRVATALLSGAGLMVLLPAIARDAITSVLRSLLDADPSVSHYLLAAATLMVLGLPLVAFVLLLRDLTSFYFHGQHLASDEGLPIFTPRFTLTGLRLPADETTGATRDALIAARHDPATIELLVPAKDSARARIDQQLDAYGGLGRDPSDGDAGRAEGLFALVAARERGLAEEVAKVEHGMARHLLRVQVIVLRYVKALLLFLATSVAVFAAAGAIEADPSVGTTTEVWLSVIYLAWTSGVVLAVGDPVRTIEQLLRSEGATRTALGADIQLTRVERIAVRIALAAFALSAAALVVTITHEHPHGRTLVFAIVAGLVTVLLFAVTLQRWISRLRRV